MASTIKDNSLERILNRFTNEMVSKTTSKMVARSSVRALKEIMGIDAVALGLFENSTVYTSRKGSKRIDEEKFEVSQLNAYSSQALKTEEMKYVFGANEEESYFHLQGSAVTAPIILGDELVGLVILESSEENFFSRDDLISIKVAAHIIGLTIEKARFLMQQRKRSNERAGLQSTMTEVIRELDLPKLLETIVSRAANLLDATGGELGIFHEEDQVLEMVVSYQLQDSHVGAKQQLGEGVMGTVAETRAPLIVDDYRKWGGRMSNYDDIRATIGVPLIAAEKLIGVFTTISSNDQKKFSQEDVELLNLFAQQAVIAIENARLYSMAQNEISEKEKIEQEISRQKEYYEALLVNNPVAIVAADMNNNIVSWNPMAEKLFGYEQEKVVGQSIDDFVANRKDMHAEATANSDQVLSGNMVHVTTKRTHKDGTLIDVELLALPVIVAGERVGFVAIYHDLTEIKKIEEELRKQNSQMLRELQLAGEIQRSFIVNDLPQIEGWGLSNVLYSAKETSGDFYDVRILPNGNIAIFIGDVVDKGVGAALFMALCWTLFRGYSGERNASPSKVFKSLNERILADTTSDQFLTAYYAILDPHSGKLTYANAGHPPSLFWSAKGQRVSRQIRTGMPIGISADVEWEDKTVTFDNGDHLLMYTDGVTEGFNNKLTDYGEKRLIDVQFAMAGSSPSEITKAVVNDLRKFAGNESQSDDIALVLLKKLKN